VSSNGANPSQRRPVGPRGELIALGLLTAAALLFLLLFHSAAPPAPPETEPPVVGYLYVCGDAVARPGAYPFRLDHRLSPREVYLRAGGDSTLVEHLPELEIVPPQLVVFERSMLRSGGRIDINDAPAALLESLPGVGPVLAGRIIDNRPFAAIEDLLAVEGIGPTTLEHLAPLIRLR